MSKPALFSHVDIVAKIREIAAERPDYKYREENKYCTYTGDPATGSSPCIVGIALFMLGVPSDWLRKSNTAAFSTIESWLANEFMAGEVDRARASWISHVQSKQDQYNPLLSWSEAVAHADRMYCPIA